MIIGKWMKFWIYFFHVVASNTVVHPTQRRCYCFFCLNKDHSCITGKWAGLWIFFFFFFLCCCKQHCCTSNTEKVILFFFYLNKDRSSIIGKWTRLWICCLDADQFDVCQLLHFAILKRDIICIMYVLEIIWAYYTLHGFAFIIIIPTSVCSTDSQAARQFLKEFFIMPNIPQIQFLIFFKFTEIHRKYSN